MPRLTPHPTDTAGMPSARLTIAIAAAFLANGAFAEEAKPERDTIVARSMIKACTEIWDTDNESELDTVVKSYSLRFQKMEGELEEQIPKQAEEIRKLKSKVERLENGAIDDLAQAVEQANRAGGGKVIDFLNRSEAVADLAENTAITAAAAGAKAAADELVKARDSLSRSRVLYVSLGALRVGIEACAKNWRATLRAEATPPDVEVGALNGTVSGKYTLSTCTAAVSWKTRAGDFSIDFRDKVYPDGSKNLFGAGKVGFAGSTFDIGGLVNVSGGTSQTATLPNGNFMLLAGNLTSTGGKLSFAGKVQIGGNGSEYCEGTFSG